MRIVDLIEKIKEGATLKYHQHALEHEEEHVLEDLGQRLAQQGMDLDTYFKMRNTTREQFLADEVKPVAKKRFERSLILDEIVRREKIEVDNAALDAEFNQTLSALTMQGVDLGKIRGGRRGQQRVAQAVAMESANRSSTPISARSVRTDGGNGERTAHGTQHTAWRDGRLL